MVRLIHKAKYIIPAALAAVSAAPLALGQIANADTTDGAKLQVNIEEVLTVDLTEPTTWASGDLSYNSTSGTYVSDLLRNHVTFKASTNNAAGITASMYADGNTNLVNQTKSTSTIPTLTSSTTAANFPVNSWGYSVNDTSEGSTTANYYALRTSSNPIALTLKSNQADIYFGAKADIETESGTYAQTVIFSAVTGVINDNTNPVVPTDPATPQNTDTNNPVVAYDSSNSRTVYTSRSTASGTTTTTTEVSSGNNVSDYVDKKGATEVTYASPQGVTSTTNNVSSNSGLAIGLAATAGVAAASGLVAFALAKRQSGDDA